MPRQPRLDAPGVLQHVIARGIEQRHIFLQKQDYQFFLNRLGSLIKETEMECYAWVLMPNHFHLLLRTGPVSLPTFMRRLLTAYSVYYNRRYGRSGHLFQNRYRSIICEEDPYFMELVRYIHLNPIRAGIVKTVSGLENYPWSGHRILMGREKATWQNSDEVLSYFDKGLKGSQFKYRNFLRDGLHQGRRPDLSGQTLSRFGIKHGTGKQTKDVIHDRRILGNSQFIQKILSRHQTAKENKLSQTTWEHLLRKTANWLRLSEDELLSGTKRQPVAHARCILSYLAVRNLGMKTTEVAQLLRISQPAVSKSVLRGEALVKQDGKIVKQLL